MIYHSAATATLINKLLADQARKSKEKKEKVDLEDAFKSADTDKDGKLTLEEWSNVLSRTGHNISRYTK